MVITNEALATKLVYLKDNHYMPDIDAETRDVQSIIRSFYNCEKTYRRDTNKLKDSDFWFRLTFCNYMVTDKFVHEINREYKRLKILNISKDEEFTD